MSKENLSGRFREERLRLGLSHAQTGEICGVSKNSVIAWEHGSKIPADALMVLMSAGFDPMYILTGQRSGAMLPSREAALLDNYRHSDEQGKRIIEQAASVAAQPLEVKKAGQVD
ncbi:MAG: helix-turn-helix transcriptional regulator [Candidatus Competibacter sp.]|nr:helix-turn-helix transcriptional regulator [Candidatus Competibacter sp.]